MQYRITPHTTTKRSPAELMFGRNLRSRLDIMRSDIQQEMNIRNYIPPTKTPSFVPGQLVQIRFYNNPTCKWRFGTIIDQRGSLNYDIMVDGIEHHRHVSQIRPTGFPGLNDDTTFDDQRCNNAPEQPTLTELPKVVQPNRRSMGTASQSIVNEPQQQARRSIVPQQSQARRSIVPPVVIMPSSPPAPTPQPPMDIIRRSERVRKQPDRLNL
jgi:hypothetical protein